MPVRSLLSAKTEAMLNDAYSNELAASHLYRHLAIQLHRNGWFGAASYFSGESREELTHADRISDFMDGRGTVAKVGNVAAVNDKLADLRDAIEIAYQTELDLERKYVSGYSGCDDEITRQFLLWFLEEQRKSVAKYSDLIARLDAVADDKTAMLLIDKELSA